jgi:hypothetical protein
LVTVELGRTLFSARPLAEYRAMFALEDSDLTGRILDCPGGAASFTADLCAAGGEVTAVDVAYQNPSGELAALARSEAERGNAYMAANASRYVWSYYPDVHAHDQARRDAAERFAHDITAHPERYVAAALPSLPFTDRSFDLVLSGHLLFTYTDRLDWGFHLQSLLELVRVARAQVRVFPLLEHTGRSDPPLLDRLREQLSALGIDSEVREVGYEFQRGGKQMLVLHGDQAPENTDT